MANASSASVQNLGSIVWSIAEILRGDFKQSEYGKVVLPFVVLRRLDCILDGTKEAVLEAEKGLPEGVDEQTRDMILFGAAGANIQAYNTSAATFERLRGQDPGQIHQNLVDYITKFSPNVRDIFLDKFLLIDQLKRLPPQYEQEQIASYLMGCIHSIEKAIDATEVSVERLIEFRSALITAAVTSQIDVTTWGKRGRTDHRLDAIEREMAS